MPNFPLNWGKYKLMNTYVCNKNVINFNYQNNFFLKKLKYELNILCISIHLVTKRSFFKEFNLKEVQILSFFPFNKSFLRQ